MRLGNGKKVFQKNFLWGNSTSSMQIEGAVKEEGKGKSVYEKMAFQFGIQQSMNITAIQKI